MSRSVSVVVLFFIAVISGCASNNVTVDNSLQKFFDANNVKGSFALYDNGQNQFTIYDLSRYRDSAYLPAATFSMLSALIGLETGIVSNEKMVIPWDGISRIYPWGETATPWNRPLSMEQAFTCSAIPYFQELSRRIGRDTLQHWVDSLGYGGRYGKAHIHTRADTCWLDNSLRVTADEQMALVIKLYFSQLPFQKRTQEIVKKAMLQEDNSNFRLSYTMGWGIGENGNAIGWVTGWIEENEHPYFFVLNLEGPLSTNLQEAGLKILKGILKEKGFFLGRK